MTTFTDFALELLDGVLGPTGESERTAAEAVRLHSLGLRVPEGAGITTKGCPKCKGTMYRTTDSGGSQYVCSKCGHVQRT